MRESANAQAQRMMSQYDSNVEEGLLPCSTDQALPCDETIANRIGYGTVRGGRKHWLGRRRRECHASRTSPVPLADRTTTYLTRSTSHTWATGSTAAGSPTSRYAAKAFFPQTISRIILFFFSDTHGSPVYELRHAKARTVQKRLEREIVVQ